MSSDTVIYYGHFEFCTYRDEPYPELIVEMIKYAKKLLEEEGLLLKEE